MPCRNNWSWHLIAFLGLQFSLTRIPAQINAPCAHHHRIKAIAAFEAKDHHQVIARYGAYVADGGILHATDLLKLSRTHLELGDTLECIEVLKREIDKGLVWFEKDSYLSLTHAFNETQQKWLDPELIGYHQHHQKYLDRIDAALVKRISGLVSTDQHVRLNKREISDEEHRQQIQAQDSITRAGLRSIFKEHNGFPADSLLDGQASFQLMLLIHHVYRSFPDEFEYLLSVVVQAVNTFQMPPNEFAVMIDRHQYMLNGSIIYGQVPKRNAEGSSSVVHVQDPINVDELRYAAGLSSLKDHCIHRNCLLPAGYRELRSPCDQ
jgi:hypothetical protein